MNNQQTITNQIKRLFLKTKEDENLEMKHLKADKSLEEEYSGFRKEREMGNSRFFAIIFEIFTLSYFILKITYLILFQGDNREDSIWGTLGVFITYLMTKGVFLVVCLCKRKYYKQAGVFINILFVYVNMVVMVFYLSFSYSAEELELREYSFIFYNLVIVSAGFYLFFSFWEIFFLIFFMVINIGIAGFICIYTQHYRMIGSYLVFAAFFYLGLIGIKQSMGSINLLSFEKSKLFSKMAEKFEFLMNSMKMSYFVFKNNELFFANKHAEGVISSFKHNPLNFTSQKMVYENMSHIMSKQSEEIKLKVDNVNSPVSSPMHEDNDALTKMKTDQKYIKKLFKHIISLEKNKFYLDEMIKQKMELVSVNDSSSGESINSNSKKMVNLYKILKNVKFLNKEITEYKLGKFGYLSQDKNIYSQVFEIMMKVENEVNIRNDKTRSNTNNNAQDNSYSGDILTELIFTDITEETLSREKIAEAEAKIRKLEVHEKNFKKQTHEFKTPLNSIIGCCNQLKGLINTYSTNNNNWNSSNSNSNSCFSNQNLLTCTRNNPNTLGVIKQHINQISNISTYVQYLIKDMLNLDNHSHEMHIKPLKVLDVLDFCYGILNSLLQCDEKKSLLVKPLISNKLMNDTYITADEIRLKQILLNFVSNSVKFTQQGSISLRTKYCERNSQVVKIVVEDTGIGIKGEDKKKLFKQYAKLTQENNDFGTGLGLNISKSLANSMNINIKVKSQERVGTKMILYIPIHGENLTPNIHFKNDLTTNYFNLNEISRNSTSYKKSKGISRCSTDKHLNIITNHCNIIAHSGGILHVNNSSNNVSNLSNNISPFKPNYNREKTRSKSNKEKLKIDLLNMTENDLEDYKITQENQNIQPFNYDIETFDYKLNKNNSNNSNTNNSSENGGKNYFNPNMSNTNNNNCSNNTNNNNKNLTFKKETYQTINNINNNFNINFGCSNDKLEKFNNKNKILVIDDQIFPRGFLVFSIKEILSDLNANEYEVLEGNDGIDCLKYILDYQNLVKFIFIDENMTFMSGSETAKIIRNLSNLTSSPKIILTSAGESDETPPNFDFCIPKPVLKTSLSEVLQKFGLTG